MIWKRVILSWMTLLALVFASAGATVATNVGVKSHVGAMDVAAAIGIEAIGLASAEGHRGNGDAISLESAGKGPQPQYGYDAPRVARDPQPSSKQHYDVAPRGYDAATDSSSLGRLPPSRAPLATSTTGAPDVPHAARGAGAVTGRIATRINLSKSGIQHVVERHLNPARAMGKSQFSGSIAEVRTLLSAKSTVQAPVRALESGNFARTVTHSDFVGNLPGKWGGAATKTFTVVSDKFGNLLSAFPGTL